MTHTQTALFADEQLQSPTPPVASRSCHPSNKTRVWKLARVFFSLDNYIVREQMHLINQTWACYLDFFMVNGVYLEPASDFVVLDLATNAAA